MKVKRVPLVDIDFPEYLLRPADEPADIEDLSFSIAKDGLLHPITVTRRGERYLLIAGFRRVRAVQSLGWGSIPANIIPLDEVQQALIPLTENLERLDVDPLQEARYIAHLIHDLGMTQEQVGGFLHRDRTTITHKLALLNMSSKVQVAISEGKISPAVALELHRIKDAERRGYIMELAIEHGCTVARARAWTQSEIPRVESPTSEEVGTPPVAPGGAHHELLSTCQVCGSQKPLDDLAVVYACQPCLDALETVKQQQATEEE